MRSHLSTQRLTLRPLSVDDAPEFTSMMGDRAVSRMTATIAYPLTYLDAEMRIVMMLNEVRRGLCFPYVITTKEDGTFMGVVSIFSNRSKALEIAYWIGRPFWGKGFATEASQCVLEESDRALGQPVMAGVFSDNPASLNVLKKLGFIETGERDKLFSMARRQKADGIRLQRSAKPAKTQPSKVSDYEVS